MLFTADIESCLTVDDDASKCSTSNSHRERLAHNISLLSSSSFSDSEDAIEELEALFPLLRLCTVYKLNLGIIILCLIC